MSSVRSRSPAFHKSAGFKGLRVSVGVRRGSSEVHESGKYHFRPAGCTMPSAPRIPKYRKHTSGQAVVRLNGRDHYLGPYGSPESSREYDRVVAEWLTTKKTIAAPGRLVATIAELVDAFVAWADGYYIKNG